MLLISINLPNLFLILFGIVVVLLLLYYLVILGRYAFCRNTKKENASYSAFPSISIVVTARDRAHNLAETLKTYLTQDYPNYEVVIVNDNSKDETEQLLREYNLKYPHLRVVNLYDTITRIRGKRFPLSIGIRAAKNDCIVLTDPSCVPVSPFWLQHIAQRFVKKTKVVLAFSGYQQPNKLLLFDNFMAMMQSFSYSINKMPVLANGHNLAYSKSFFFDHTDTFFAKATLPFGEDDIFVNQINDTSAYCNYEDHPDSFIIQPTPNFEQWLTMKKNSCLTRQHYKFFHRFLLKFYNFLSLLFYVTLGFSAYYVIDAFVKSPSTHHIIMLSTFAFLFVVKETIQYVVYGKAAIKLNARKLIPFIIFYDLLFSIINPLIYLMSKLGKQWK